MSAGLRTRRVMSVILAEECFTVLHGSCKTGGGKGGAGAQPCEKTHRHTHTLCTTVSSSHTRCLNHSGVQQMPVVILISPPCYFLLLLILCLLSHLSCDVWRAHSWFQFSALSSIPQCLQPVTGKPREGTLRFSFSLFPSPAPV